MFARALQNLAPRPRWRSLSWARRFARFPDGAAFEAEKFPYLAAPGGPFDALDDPDVRVIWLQIGIRMGKTLFGQIGTQFYADVHPYNMLFATPDKTLSEQVAARTTAMIEHNPRLRDQLPIEKDRNKHEIKLDHCKVFVGWFRSHTTLADKDILFGHANEISKIVELSTSTEGDALQRFLDRGSNKPNHKYILESTPARKDHCRVERGRLGSSNCHMQCPCPHCGRYQKLELDQLKWDHNKEGHSEKELSRATARYECIRCGKAIRDEHRQQMIRDGVWVPEGAKVNDKEAIKAARAWVPKLKGTDGAAVDDVKPWRGWKYAKWIRGTPARDGREAGYQLSRLYDLSITWGDIAAKFVEVKDNKRLLRAFVNEWLADTWADVRVRHEWFDVGKRLSIGYRRGTVPAEAWFLTAGVDVQEDRCYWVVRAWGEHATSWLIDWGVCRQAIDGEGLSPLNSDLNQLDALVINRQFPVNGKTCEGFESLTPAKICIDTGYRIHHVHQFLRGHPGDRVRAVAGDQHVKAGFYRLSVLEKNVRTGKPYEGGLAQWQLNVDAYKEDVRDRFAIPLGECGAWYLPHDMLKEPGAEDYLKQVCNEQPTGERRVWKMLHERWGNHYGDCEIYGRAGADFVSAGDWEQPLSAPAEAKPAAKPAGGRRSMSRRRMTRRSS